MRINVFFFIVIISFLIFNNHLFAHGMSEEEKQLIIDGGNLKYIYIGMTHMLTGYDHLFFIFGVLFYINGFREILKFITAFTIGHSITLIFATFNAIQINYYLIDAIIALSVSYIAFINLNGFEKLFKRKPFNMLLIVFLFGLIHGLGLSTRLQQLPLNQNDLLINILSFNIGIEVGQIIALIFMFFILRFIYVTNLYKIMKQIVNIFLFMSGLVLFFYQIIDYYNSTTHQNIEFKNRIEIKLLAKSEIEYKVWMLKNQKLTYSWQVEGTQLYYDFHGEPSSSTNGYFESFKEGTSSKDSGSLTTKFIGTHGWYWKNNSERDVLIILNFRTD